ncbi:hypothetical protein P886_4181 [Alteromonadaceae bacterium 2753L.S.0a.02]|nr:hypothetical protein P886_4181 [Alteromonadaceae bacterium 2753L.S.0a.02]
MKTSLLSIALASAIAASAHAKTLTVGTDLSQSNLLLTNELFARQAASYAANKVLNLENGDTVRVLSFGALDAPENIESQPFVISKRHRAKKVAGATGGKILHMIKSAGEGQPNTNIVAFFEINRSFGCDQGGEILILSDGLEASVYISPEKFKNGKQSLPKPDVDLTGCTVTFYGLGAGWSDPRQIKYVTAQWKSYIEAAGGVFKLYKDQ